MRWLTTFEIIDVAKQRVGNEEEQNLWESILHYIEPLRSTDLGYMETINTAQDLLNRVALAFLVDVGDLIGRSRKRKLVEARCVFAIIGSRYGLTEKFIGKMIDRDYSTISHYLTLHKNTLSHDGSIQLIIKSIESKLLIK